MMLAPMPPASRDKIQSYWNGTVTKSDIALLETQIRHCRVRLKYTKDQVKICFMVAPAFTEFDLAICQGLESLGAVKKVGAALAADLEREAARQLQRLQ